MTSLFTHMRRFVSLDEEEEAVLAAGLRQKKLRKKEFLLKEGQVCAASYFVLKGCLRMYFIREDGVEQIIQFAIENWWITDFQSLDWQQSSRFHIQAIEPSEIVILDRSALPALAARVPQLDRYLRLIVQRAFAAAQQKLFFVHTFSGEERYRHFADAFPQFVQRIPQYMVASYLGFTPEFISKVKGRRK